MNLFSLRRTYGASAGAVAAVNAAVGVDYVNRIAGADAANRTLSLTSTAADAFIRDFICHLSHLLKFCKDPITCGGCAADGIILSLTLLYHKFREKGSQILKFFVKNIDIFLSIQPVLYGTEFQPKAADFVCAVFRHMTRQTIFSVFLFCSMV